MKLSGSNLAALSAVFLTALGTAAATPITGVLNISGSVEVSGTTTQTIDFLPLDTLVGSVAADPFTNTGSFAVLNTMNTAAPATGTIKDLTGPPLTGSIIVPSFISGFSLGSNIVLNLSFINAGTNGSAGCGAAPAAGDICTPPGSPFNLSDVASGGTLATAINLGVSGTAVNTLTGEVSDFTGLLTTQIPGITYQQILSTLAAGGSIETSYSGSFTAVAVPEPATFGFIGFALVGLGMLARKRRVRS